MQYLRKTIDNIFAEAKDPEEILKILVDTYNSNKGQEDSFVSTMSNIIQYGAGLKNSALGGVAGGLGGLLLTGGVLTLGIPGIVTGTGFVTSLGITGAAVGSKIGMGLVDITSRYVPEENVDERTRLEGTEVEEAVGKLIGEVLGGKVGSMVGVAGISKLASAIQMERSTRIERAAGGALTAGLITTSKVYSSGTVSFMNALKSSIGSAIGGVTGVPEGVMGGAIGGHIGSQVGHRAGGFIARVRSKITGVIGVEVGKVRPKISVKDALKHTFQKMSEKFGAEDIKLDQLKESIRINADLRATVIPLLGSKSYAVDLLETRAGSDGADSPKTKSGKRPIKGARKRAKVTKQNTL